MLLSKPLKSRFTVYILQLLGLNTNTYLFCCYLGPIGRILVTFEMFIDEDFIHKYQPYEFPLKLKEQRNLYFQLILNTTHESINVVLDSCYTKTESKMRQWNGNRKYYFVQNRYQTYLLKNLQLLNTPHP